MSAPVNNTFLNNILGGVMSPGSNGFGSGLSNVLTGVSLGGNSGTSGALSGVLGSLGSLVPGLGAVTGLIPGLDGFLKSGMDFSCLGSQAFNSDDYNAKVDRINQMVKNTDNSNLHSVADLASNLAYEIGESAAEIAVYRSGCSKKLRQQYLDYCKTILDKIPRDLFDIRIDTQTDWEGKSWKKEVFVVKAGVSAVASNSVPVSISDDEKVKVEQYVSDYAMQNGLTFSEAAQQVGAQFFPGGVPAWWVNIGSGSNGGTVYDVGVTNKKPNYLGYLLLAAGVFGVFKLIKK